MSSFLYYFTGKTSSQKLLVHRHKRFHIACFHCAFAFIMNQHRALLRLFQRVFTNFYKRFYHKIKSIDIIIIENQLIFCILFLQEKNICLFLCL